jgi:hypothetical protein
MLHFYFLDAESVAVNGRFRTSFVDARGGLGRPYRLPRPMEGPYHVCAWNRIRWCAYACSSVTNFWRNNEVTSEVFVLCTINIIYPWNTAASNRNMWRTCEEWERSLSRLTLFTLTLVVWLGFCIQRVSICIIILNVIKHPECMLVPQKVVQHFMTIHNISINYSFV